MNEIAPRPHNSGYYSTSSMRARPHNTKPISALPSPSSSATTLIIKCPLRRCSTSSARVVRARRLRRVCARCPRCERASLRQEKVPQCHKMGHIAITANSDTALRACLRQLLQRPQGEDADSGEQTLIYMRLRYRVRVRGSPTSSPLVGVIPGSDSNLPVMLPAAHILDRFHMPSVRTNDRLRVSQARRTSGERAECGVARPRGDSSWYGRRGAPLGWGR
jgi:phosphoribosylaminoimidazole carboxylase